MGSGPIPSLGGVQRTAGSWDTPRPPCPGPSLVPLRHCERLLAPPRPVWAPSGSFLPTFVTCHNPAPVPGHPDAKHKPRFCRRPPHLQDTCVWPWPSLLQEGPPAPCPGPALPWPAPALCLQAPAVPREPPPGVSVTPSLSSMSPSGRHHPCTLRWVLPPKLPALFSGRRDAP